MIMPTKEKSKLLVFVGLYLFATCLAQSCPEDISKLETRPFSGSDIKDWIPIGTGEIGRNINVGLNGEMQFQFTDDNKKEHLQEVFAVQPDQYLFKDLSASTTFTIDRALDDAIIRFGWMVPDTDWRGTAAGAILGDYQAESIGGNPVYDIPEGSTSRYLTTISYDQGEDKMLWPKDLTSISFGADVLQADAQEYELVAHFKNDKGFDIPPGNDAGKPYTLNINLQESSVSFTGHSGDDENSDLLSFGFKMKQPNLSLMFGVEGYALEKTATMVSVQSVSLTGCRILSEEEKKTAADKAEAERIEAERIKSEKAEADALLLQQQNANAGESQPEPSSSSSPSSSSTPDAPSQSSSSPLPNVSVFTSTSTGIASSSKSINKKIKTVYETTSIDPDGELVAAEMEADEQSSVHRLYCTKRVLGCIVVMSVLVIL